MPELPNEAENPAHDLPLIPLVEDLFTRSDKIVHQILWKMVLIERER